MSPSPANSLAPSSLAIDRIPSPIGTIVLVADADGLCALDFADHEPRMMQLLRRRFGEVAFVEKADPHGASTKLRAYFAGRLDAVDAVPVSMGGTAFQNSAWVALREIRVGTTLTYSALAAKIGKPRAIRAAGLANAVNPVSIVVPCHRVIGADGSLTGYGGGLPRKRWLLEHEGVRLDMSAAKRARGAQAIDTTSFPAAVRSVIAS
jgi:methylated-DNA-[protein]-cysteine S-methyltransferase